MFTEQLLNEVSFNFSRSGGKGGQNVNKVETKVELIFNINKSGVLTNEQKELLGNNLKNKIDKDGNLRLISQTERTQLGNRKKVLEKFNTVIEKALKKKKKRKKTRIPEIARLKMLELKRRHGEMKRERKRVVID